MTATPDWRPNCTRYSFTLCIREKILFFFHFLLQWLRHYTHWLVISLDQLNRRSIPSNDLATLIVCPILARQYPLTAQFSYFHLKSFCAFQWPHQHFLRACATVHAGTDLLSNLQIFSVCMKGYCLIQKLCTAYQYQKGLLAVRSDESLSQYQRYDMYCGWCILLNSCLFLVCDIWANYIFHVKIVITGVAIKKE